MEKNRIQLFQYLKPNNYITQKNVDEFKRVYFGKDDGTKTLWEYMTSTQNPKKNGFLYSDTLESFYKLYCCDLEWAKTTSYCGGNNNTTIDPNSERQKNINKNYCSLDSNKKINLPGSAWNGSVWNLYKDYYTVTSAEEDIAKNSCGGSNNTNQNNNQVIVQPPATGCKSTNATGADIISGTLIKKCVKGDIVGKIQERLKVHGFPNFSKNGVIDNTYGSRTKQMVIDFQSSKGLTPDGVVGPKTWTELVKDKSSSTNKPTKTSSPFTDDEEDEVGDINNTTTSVDDADEV